MGNDVECTDECRIVGCFTKLLIHNGIVRVVSEGRNGQANMKKDEILTEPIVVV